VDAAAVRYVKVVMAEPVVVGNDVHPRSGSPLNLPTHAFP
jgi:hypothetical protein